MTSLPADVSQEVGRFYKPYLTDNPDDFVCVYGSSLYKGSKSRSDIDLFLVTSENIPASTVMMNGMVHFIRDMHIRLGRKIDEEVPYENKIYYTYNEVADAVCYSGFDHAEDTISIPDIIKETNFLSSPEVKARLALNALTTPHAVVALNLDKYKFIRKQAEDAVTLLAIHLTGQMECEVTDLYQSLVISKKNDESGEMFLGYKTEHSAVEAHLMSVLERGALSLAGSGLIKRIGGKVLVDRNIFRPRQAMYNSVHGIPHGS